MKLKKKGFLKFAFWLSALIVVSSVPAAACEQIYSGKRVSNQEDTKMALIASNAQPVMLGDKSQTVALAKSGTKTLASRVKTLAAGKRIYLIVRKLCAMEAPGVLYHLYLNLPSNVKPGANNSDYVGSLNFYDAVVLADDPGAVENSTRFFSFDVTEIIKNMEDKKLLKDAATVTIFPSGAPDARSKPVIGELDLIEQ